MNTKKKKKVSFRTYRWAPDDVVSFLDPPVCFYFCFFQSDEQSNNNIPQIQTSIENLESKWKWLFSDPTFQAR